MFVEPHHLDSDSGWIEVICGSMFSGKTEELIRRMRRAEFANQKVRIFKPATDTRFAEDAVVAHTGNQIPSETVTSARQILLMLGDEQVVGIDEAQFFDDSIVDVANELANRGIRVLVAGLDMDYQGKPFGPMPLLLATAEFVTKLHAICVRTGRLAHYSHRRLSRDNSSDEKQIKLGAREAYEPLSRQAYLEARKRSGK